MLQVVTDTSLGFSEQEEADQIKSLEKVNAIPMNLIIPLHVKRFVLPNGQSQ